MEQWLQVAGAIAILVAFVAVQMRRMEPTQWSYLSLNTIGGAVLAVLAALDRDWGFLLLEGVWTLVSAWALVRKARGLEPAV